MGEGLHIAIVAPSAVPFTIGGAENLAWGLQEHLNRDTPHQAELIKLPSPEGDFWSLMRSYRAFSQLDLAHFDLVVSTKYPSWMIRHPRHVCFMLHRLRGLYDTYHFCGAPERCDYYEPGVRDLQRLMRARAGERATLDETFERLEALRTAGLPDTIFSFPGPFTREVVHFLDGIGLAPHAVHRYAAISETVARRKDYFPTGAQVHVAYPPSRLGGLRPGEFRHLFTVSRLDGPKRMHLLVEAMRHVRSSVSLKIAGTGPEAERLRMLAGKDERIELLGFLNDREIASLYADSLAVPFVPYDEDLGLVTLEAMMCEKPVLTVTDAGGPNEFVTDGETGYSVAPQPAALGAAIERLCARPDEARRMGRNAYSRAAMVTWENAAAILLNDAPGAGAKPVSRRGRREKLTVGLSFPVFPPRGGGQTRVFHLYRRLARHFDVDFVTLGEQGTEPCDSEIAPGVREIRVPKSSAHAAEEAKWSARVGWIPVSDVALPLLHTLTPAYAAAIAASTRHGDVCVASHPFAWPALQVHRGRRFWYEAQDHEGLLKQEILPDTPDGRKLLELTRETEGACCRGSEIVFAVTREDARLLGEWYQTPAERLRVVPNGVDLETTPFVSFGERRALKRRLGLDGRQAAVFMGSWHGPNIVAARRVLDLARALPTVQFLLLGSVCQALAADAIPGNAKLLGVLEDEAKAIVLGAADIAVNPMAGGSGSNLKMLDYMAAGVPVLTSPFGARGLGLGDGEAVHAELDAFADATVAALAAPAMLEQIAQRARLHVERDFSWDVIAGRFMRSLGLPA